MPVYVFDFKRLASNINWDNMALWNQFYWGLQDDVKNILLSMSDPQTLNEAINEATKCDYCLFECVKDQFRLATEKYLSHSFYTLDPGANLIQVDVV